MFGDSRLPDSFWEKVSVEPNTGCWLWAAFCKPDGYALCKVAGKTKRAHRVAYAALVGSIPSGLHCDHLCRVRSCVNPAHIELVTLAENLRRGVHGNSKKTACAHGHLFDEKNTYIYPDGSRGCRICHRLYEQKRRSLIE